MFFAESALATLTATYSFLDPEGLFHGSLKQPHSAVTAALSHARTHGERLWKTLFNNASLYSGAQSIFNYADQFLDTVLPPVDSTCSPSPTEKRLTVRQRMQQFLFKLRQRLQLHGGLCASVLKIRLSTLWESWTMCPALRWPSFFAIPKRLCDAIFAAFVGGCRILAHLKHIVLLCSQEPELSFYLCLLNFPTLRETEKGSCVTPNEPQ